MSKIFQSYQGGGPGPLPPGYMQAATAPGRSIAAGLQSMGESIGQGIRERRDRKQQRKGYESYLKHAHGATDDELAGMSLGDLQGLSRAREGEMVSQERKLALQERRARINQIGQQQEQQRKGYESYLKHAHGATDDELAGMSLGDLQGLSRAREGEMVSQERKLALQERKARLGQIGQQQRQTLANQQGARIAYDLHAAGDGQFTQEMRREVQHRAPDMDPMLLQKLGEGLNKPPLAQKVTVDGENVGYAVKSGVNFIPNKAPTGIGKDLTDKQLEYLPQIREELVKNTLIKDYSAAKSGYEEMKNLFETQDSGPGDIAGITKFMKALDPEGVVREGEFKVARKSGGVPDNFLNMFKEWSSGTLLPPKVRREFIAAAKSVVDTKLRSARGAQNGLKRQLKAYNIPEDSIAWTIEDDMPTPPGSAATSHGPQPLLSTPPPSIDATQYPAGTRAKANGRLIESDGTKWHYVK